MIEMDATKMDHEARVKLFLSLFPGQPRAVAEAVSRLYEKNPDYFTEANLEAEGAAFTCTNKGADDVPLMQLKKVTPEDTQGLFQQLEAQQEPLPTDEKNINETIQLITDEHERAVVQDGASTVH